ncbi:hypothetical protein PROVRETT_08439 [Providencia rettgeri DSM 1131]|nr:hypothetical protein PROVRETT_08439 [Providencia rettgeri DSM 1131]
MDYQYNKFVPRSLKILYFYVLHFNGYNQTIKKNKKQPQHV